MTAIVEIHSTLRVMRLKTNKNEKRNTNKLRNEKDVTNNSTEIIRIRDC